jgi:hypothetical protein
MKGGEGYWLEKLRELLGSLNVNNFEVAVAQFLERKDNQQQAIHELDSLIASLSNHLLTLSILLKQKYLVGVAGSSNSAVDNSFYTRQEIAIKYRVSVRTVSNWIASGLVTENIGGVKRISQQSLSNFMKVSKTKKPHWRSIAR